MSNRSWVTLATNDSYGLGALVLAHSLRRAGSVYPAVVLITPSVTEAMRERLRAVFAEVVTVDVLDSRDAAHLALLQRPELGITFTKIHCWNLTQYEKCVFLDADILVVQNCDELFEREELSAAPDVGWPDCFNSGVFVFKPSAETFDKLIKFAQERGSFDGGDQGLLNSFFSDWAQGDINKHLPFLYNVTSAAFYSYLPALKHYGQNLKVIHFIGAAKPWLQQFNWESRHVDAPEHLREFLQLWWDLFVSQVHSHLDIGMSGVAGNLARVALGGGYEAIDDLTRRQGWEAGNIDYMGVDAFENIWAKISQTLSQPRSSPPKQSPPREPAPAVPQPPVVSEKPVLEQIEVAKEALPAEAPVVPAQVPAPVEAATVAPSEIEAPVVPAEVAAPVAEVITSKTAVPSEVAAPVAEVITSKTAVPSEATAAVEAPAVVNTQVESEVSSPAAVPDVVPEVIKPAESAPVATKAPVAPQPAADDKPVAQEVPAPVKADAPIEIPESEVPVPVETIDQISVPKTAETEVKKTEAPEIKSTPTKAVVGAPKCVETVKATPPSPAPAEVADSSAVPEATPEKVQAADVSTDSPPLANTPSKEEAPAVPAAKSAERCKPAGKLQLGPPAAPDPLPTPDSELEDAATLAQSIIASELRAPTVTAPPPAAASPSAAPEQTRLVVDEPVVPTPPVGAVSLSQIGVKSAKGKSSTAAQIESSVTEKAEPPTPTSPSAEVAPATPAAPAASALAAPAPAAGAPKKKVVKKVVKKEGAGGADAPVPPPRKKEKKPKEK